MKETYRVPRPPEISLNGNLRESHNSEELLSVLGFCTPEASAAQDPRRGEPRGLHVTKTPYPSSDDDDLVCRKDSPFHPRMEEAELAVNAECIL
jgi:hypothetical protein